MNFLDLCRELRQESGLSGDGPSAVTGQSGMSKKIVDWINSSVYDLESYRDNWAWMWRTGSITTTVGQQSYDLPSLGFDANKIVAESLSIERTGEPNTITQFELVSWDIYREKTAFRTANPGQPVFCALAPNDYLYVDTLPDRSYTIKFAWYRKPAYLSTNTDIPTIPVQFHRILVEMGLMKYAAHDGATETYQASNKEYMKWLRRMEASQLPVVEVVSTLA